MALLSIQMLGPFAVQKDGQPLAFTYDKVRALLAYLAAEKEGPVPRARLANLLWPDQPQSAAQDSLRQAISRLRAVLDDRGAEPVFLISERDSLCLNWHGIGAVQPGGAGRTGGAVTCDLALFQSDLAQAAAHPHRSLAACASCAAILENAVQRVRGIFLEDLYLPDSDVFENWATTYRERIKVQALQALNALSAFYERQGSTDKVLEYTTRQLDIDAYNESAHCQMIRALARSGQRSQAAAHYQRMAQMLEAELGIAPAQETQALYEELKSGRELPNPAVQSVRNLPAPFSALIGREVELSELGIWLADRDRRLITVTGPGGVGKTRLVNQAVRQAAAMFSGGAVYVSLSHYGGAASLDSALAEAVSLASGPSPDLWPQLVAYFRGREMLLVLDGFEHALDERVRVSQLLEANAGLVVLVTSRERLHLPGEWVFELGGLNVPPPSIPGRYEAYSAVQMFCQFALQVNPAFALDASNQDAVGEICRLTGGMPLALLLAAAWTHSLPCPEIAREIRRSLDFLSSRAGLDGGHSSVRAVFEQSWTMLDDEERAVFSRLAVFRGGFDRAAAEAVALASVENLARLADKSLLRVTPEGRYDLHDLMIQFGTEKLREAGDEEAARQRHFDYYYCLAEQNDGQLSSKGRFDSFVWLVRESANLGEAIAWARRSPDRRNRGDQLAAWLHPEFHQDGLHMLIQRGHI